MFLLRRAAVAIIVLLPIVILWLVPALGPVPAADIIPQAPVPTARWTANSTEGTCQAVMVGTPVANQQVAIDKSRAASIGAGVIKSQTNLYSRAGKTIVPIGPTLTQRQYPDGQSRLAWLFGEGRVTRQDAMDASVDFVYVDAQTGEPLLLTGLDAGDPSFTCPELFFQPMDLFGVTTWFNFATIATVIYLLALAIIAVVLWRRSRSANRNAAAHY